MKKVNKTLSSKKGFTTVEMLLVIAIIVILSGVTIGGIREMLANANRNATSAEQHFSNMDSMYDDVEKTIGTLH